MIDIDIEVIKMRVKTKIQKWGNSLALRLTGLIKTIPHFEENMLVIVEVDEKCLKVFPVKPKQKKKLFTEDELLKGLTSITAHADEIAKISDIERGE
jgi:antitoxin MazE